MTGPGAIWFAEEVKAAARRAAFYKWEDNRFDDVRDCAYFAELSIPREGAD